MAGPTPKGPFKLVTVNTAPERAFRLIGRLTEELKERYTIVHAANCETIEEVLPKVEEIQPELLVGDNRRNALSARGIGNSVGYLEQPLNRADRSRGQQFCASMWTSEQATQIQVIAQKARPGIKTYAIPHGLQVEKGPDAIVEHLVENVPKLLEQ